MTKLLILLFNILLLLQELGNAFVTTRSIPAAVSTDSSRYPTNLYMSTIDHRRRHQASTSSRIFPSIFPGQSLAHNLHEAVLGVLINSNGQNILSTQSLHDVKPQVQARRRSSPALSTSSSSTKSSNQRTVQKVEKFERIPTWPTHNGLRFNAISKINPSLGAKLEHQYGGADCPNLWLEDSKQQYTSPFLMMCHHNHSFDLNDPIRLIEKNFIPEGFPSHVRRMAFSFVSLFCSYDMHCKHLHFIKSLLLYRVIVVWLL